jgi:arginase family enzyme
LESAHIALTARVAEAIRAGAIPFVVGGGNDQSYPNAAGLLSTLQSTDNMMVMNIDAHLDVRPLIEGTFFQSSYLTNASKIFPEFNFLQKKTLSQVKRIRVRHFVS